MILENLAEPHDQQYYDATLYYTFQPLSTCNFKDRNVHCCLKRH